MFTDVLTEIRDLGYCGNCGFAGIGTVLVLTEGAPAYGCDVCETVTPGGAL